MSLMQLQRQITNAALFIFAVGIFVSISLSALGHVLFTLAGALAVWHWWSTNRRFHISSSGAALLFLVLTIILSVLFNLDVTPNGWSNMTKVKYFLIPLLGIVVVRQLLPLSPPVARGLLRTFVIAATLASLSGIIAYYTGFNPLKMKPGCHPERACGMYGMYMTYGYGISLMMVLLTGMLIYRRKLEQLVPTWLLATAWAINGLGLYLSMARGGWIGFLAVVPLFFFKHHKKTMMLLGAALATVTLSLYAFSPSFKNFLSQRSVSDAQRISFAQAAFAAFQEKPLLGWGYRNFEPNSGAIKKKYKIEHETYNGHAHNNLLEHLASTGALGALAYLAFILLWIWEAYRRDDLVAQLTFPFAVSFALSGLFQYTFGDGENLFLIMGVYMMFQATAAKVINKSTVSETLPD